MKHQQEQGVSMKIPFWFSFGIAIGFGACIIIVAYVNFGPKEEATDRPAPYIVPTVVLLLYCFLLLITVLTFRCYGLTQRYFRPFSEAEPTI